MPYSIRTTKGGGADLIKKDTGKKVSHHSSKAKAQAAIRAIYANTVEPSDIKRRY